MYYYIKTDSQIFLIMIFNKNEQDGLTTGQKKLVAQQIKDLREEK